MNQYQEVESNGFLSASQLLQTKGIGNVAWDDWQQSENALPKIGKKYFEPTGSWLEEMQLDNGLKNRKRLMEIERVDRSVQLASAEWLPNIQKARVTKKSGHKWENFGIEEKAQLYLLPEEALLLLEMNCLELCWNGMPLSIEQAYEVLINSETSKCTLDEYRVYAQLVRWGYRLQRFREKSSLESKSSNTTKRIIMNPEGLWTPNTSPTIDKQISDSNGSTSVLKSQIEDVSQAIKTDVVENNNSRKVPKIGIVSEETVIGSIKIVKNDVSPVSDAITSGNQVSKWPCLRIQRNIKLMPKRSDKSTNSNNITTSTANTNLDLKERDLPDKRKSSNSKECSSAKKSRPEVIELSDDEIEEIPRPMSRMEILNTLPNLASGNDLVIAEIHRAYIPHGVKPTKDFYRYDRKRLLNLSETDKMLKSSLSVVDNVHNGQTNHFYSQPNQCQAITTYNSNNGYSYRGMRCEQDGDSYIEQNISHNTIHSPFSGTVVQSNCVNFVMEVMGNKVRSFRQQQFQQTTFCQNLSQLFSPRYSYPQQRLQPYSVNYWNPTLKDQYSRRGNTGGYLSCATSSKGEGHRYSYSNDTSKSMDEPCLPSFSKRPGVTSWSDLKKKWRDERTITIEDEEPTQTDSSKDGNEVQVVEETINPLISIKTGISNLSEVYERLRIVRSAIDRTVRSRKMDYSLSYEIYPVKNHYKKSSPGMPMCRLFVINSQESFIDTCKLQRLQQESKDVPVVVAFVSQSCISYVQPGVIRLPHLT